MMPLTPYLSLDAPVPPSLVDEAAVLTRAAEAPPAAGGADRAAGADTLNRVARALIALGAFGVAAGALAALTTSGAMVAAGILLVIIGVALRFPALLNDGGAGAAQLGLRAVPLKTAAVPRRPAG